MSSVMHVKWILLIYRGRSDMIEIYFSQSRKMYAFGYTNTVSFSQDLSLIEESIDSHSVRSVLSSIDPRFPSTTWLVRQQSSLSGDLHIKRNRFGCHVVSCFSAYKQLVQGGSLTDIFAQWSIILLCSAFRVSSLWNSVMSSMCDH